MTAGIYKIQHVESGRCYIGSSVDVGVRMRKHREALRRSDHVNPALMNAWLAYGEEAFAFSVVLICRPEDMIMYENQIIGFYRSNVKPFGYNHRIAAESNRGMESARLEHRAGDKYNRLTLVSVSERLKNGNKWLCTCDCGKETIANVAAVKHGKIRSCGCVKAEMLRTNRSQKPGDKFNRLTMIKPAGISPGGLALWLCRCDCGNELTLSGSRVSRGQVKSCGCLRSIAAFARYAKPSLGSLLGGR